jgi:peptide deformylase
MNIQSIVKISLLGLSLFLIVGCTENGFDPNDKQMIYSADNMSIMPLLTVEDKSDSLFLRQDSRRVSKSNIESKIMAHLKSRMLATVTDSLNQGVGLAAPQVGIGINLILVQRFDKTNEPFEFYFNPKIEEYGDSINSGFEGCLSVPGYRGRVERSQNIRISYIDSVGNKKNEEISDFTAVIFQHEIDHIKGILYFDHIFGGFNSLTPSQE